MNQTTPIDDQVHQEDFNTVIEPLKKLFDSLIVVRSAEQLREMELRITALTDAFAGQCMKTILQRSVQDEQLNNQALALVKQAPHRMKNQALRPVTIHPYRGAPFTIETAYFYKAGLSQCKAEQKGGSIRT